MAKTPNSQLFHPSGQDERAGTLYLIGTPIGNLEDMTLRGLRLLKEADLILAEDTRHTRKLLSYYDIHTPLTSYYKETEKRKAPEILARLRSGKTIALVSDAGMPGISDPGAYLVQTAREHGVRTEILPGPSAVLTALVGAGFPNDCFSFFGFLDAKTGPRCRFLETLRQRSETLVFFLSPHKLDKILKDILDILGDRPAVLCREMTKIHEDYISGTISQLIENAAQITRGEYTLVIDGNHDPEESVVSESIQEQLDRLQADGLTLNQAIARVARQKNLPRPEVYALAHAIHKK
ncbi:16S rRNA (cytidine(1402)-2'-O)-methyltransferase [bacterium]|nr:16S rRNA (cytidine(1402)-2'-O)-methyltransferase [bacterium]